jgi:hypothetical protein
VEQLLSPTSTVAVIFGAHDWARAGLQNAPSFRRSAAQFQRYLLAASPFGLGLEPDLLLYMFDDPSPAGAQLARIGETITDLVRERRQTPQRIKDILVYFIGHTTVDDGHLNFLVRDTRQGIEAQTGIAASALARVLRVTAPQQRRVIILDCCFSEAAADGFGAMGPLDEAVAATVLSDLEPIPPPDRGTLLLCSSPRRRPSIGKPHDERTLFTGALLHILTEGSHRRAPMLCFADLRDDVYDRMLREYGAEAPRPALHQPEQQAGDLTRVPAFPNLAAIDNNRPVSPSRSERAPPVVEPNSELKKPQPRRPPRKALRTLFTLLRHYRSVTLVASSLALLAAILAFVVIPALLPANHSSPDPKTSGMDTQILTPSKEVLNPNDRDGSADQSRALIGKSTCLVNCK